MYCNVIVDIVHERVAHAYTYAVPHGMTLSPGQRVYVPFGNRNKEGIVISLSETTDYESSRIRPVSYCTGRQYPPNSTILPPDATWTSYSGVLFPSIPSFLLYSLSFSPKRQNRTQNHTPVWPVPCLFT